MKDLGSEIKKYADEKGYIELEALKEMKIQSYIFYDYSDNEFLCLFYDVKNDFAFNYGIKGNILREGDTIKNTFQVNTGMRFQTGVDTVGFSQIKPMKEAIESFKAFIQGRKGKALGFIFYSGDTNFYYITKGEDYEISKCYLEGEYYEAKPFIDKSTTRKVDKKELLDIYYKMDSQRKQLIEIWSRYEKSLELMRIMTLRPRKDYIIPDKVTVRKKEVMELGDKKGITDITPLEITILNPKGESTRLKKEDVWGKFDGILGEMVSSGYVVAKSGDKCPVWKDTIPYKNVTVICPLELEGEVEYWLEYVHGTNCVSMRKELGDGTVALRSDYKAW